MRECLHCKTDLDKAGKNRKAVYCSIRCKSAHFRFKDPADAARRQKEYSDTYMGRALRLYWSSKRRDPVNYELTPNWISEKIQKGFCEVTGLPFIYKDIPGRQAWVPSLDKKDPTKGYTKENTRLVVWIYNSAKNVYTDEEVLLMAKALVYHEKDC